MRILNAIGIACILASPSFGQAVPVTPPDTPTRADVAAAQAAAANAAAIAATAVQPVDLSNAIAAATPADCPAPMGDALVASAGTQPRCMPRPDAVRATQVQRTSVVTAADGSFSGTWPVAFPSVPGWYQADIDIAGVSTAPYKCSFIAGTVTATSFTGKCTQLVSTTLPATVTAVLGLTISPIQNASGGLTVRIAGRL